MSSLEHTKDSDQENEPMDYEVEKLKEENALLKQSLERERKRIAELTAHNSSLLLPGMYLDVTLLVEGKRMAVHQNILSAHSPVLAALMKRGQNEDGVVVITGTKVDTFEMLLRFIYTGQVPLLERLAATELMAAAKEYQMEGLKKRLLGQLVTHLPDLCLAALFRQMTLEDQIEARKVCRRWADLVPETTSKRHELILLLGDKSIEEFEEVIDSALFGSRRILKLLLNADGTAVYPTRRLTAWNSLHMDSLDEASAEEIASTFTEIKELQVTASKDLFSMAGNLGLLLGLWSNQLVTLQLFESYIEDYEAPPDHIHWRALVRLFSAINAQSTLRKLHLDLYYIPVPHLSIVSKLEELHFYSVRTTSDEFKQILQKYGKRNRRLARIEYTDFLEETSDEDEDNDSNGQELFSGLSKRLCRCFTRIKFSLIFDIARISAHFSGLTSLDLYPGHITVRHLFTHLATLDQLIHLNLVINPDSFLADDLEHLLLPQVKSVKAFELRLHSSLSVHQLLAQLKFAWTLPNVEVIRFWNVFHCTECNIGNFMWPSEQAKSCLRKLFAPLKRDCAKLRLIKHNDEFFCGTAEELLAE